MAWVYLMIAGIFEWGWPGRTQAGARRHRHAVGLDRLCGNLHGRQRLPAAHRPEDDPDGHRLCGLDRHRCGRHFRARPLTVQRAGHAGALLLCRPTLVWGELL
jgi:hypothetical protein